jgi:hypothetical protein
MDSIIPQFDAGTNIGLTPTDVGVESYGRAGRTVAELYDRAGSAIADAGRSIASGATSLASAALAHIDHAQISAGAQHGVDFLAQKDQEWNDLVKDPNTDVHNPAVAQKFIEENLEPALQDFTNGFTTDKSQAWADDFAQRVRQHFLTKTAADMSSVAGAADHSTALKTIDTLGSMTFKDPSSLGVARDTLKANIDGLITSSPTLTPEKAAELRGDLLDTGERHLVHQAVTATILQGGDWRSIANDPRNAQYIDPSELVVFAKAQKAADRTAILQNQAIADHQKKQNEDAAKTAYNQNLTNNASIDPTTGRVTLAPDYFSSALKLATLPNAPPDLARTAIDWGEQKLKENEAISSDPDTRKSLTDGLFDPDKPTTRVDLMKAQINGKLSNQDFASMERLVTTLEQQPLGSEPFKETMKAAEGTLTYAMPGMPGKDPTGLTNYSRFVQSFLPQYLQQTRAGTLPPNALDLSDPNSLISKSIAPYKRTPAQMLADRIKEVQILGNDSAATPSVAPVKVATPADAAKLTPGTHYVTPDGQERIR